MPKAKKKITVKEPPWQGDHGPQTSAQMEGCEIVEPDDLKGNNPNRVGQKKRENVLDRLHYGDAQHKAGKITLRQHQAGRYIQDAHGRVEMLSSGQPLTEKVQSSPTPDKIIDIQVDAYSRLKYAMDAVPGDMRKVIETVCWDNLPISSYERGIMHGSEMAKLKVALELVANKLGY